MIQIDHRYMRPWYLGLLGCLMVVMLPSQAIAQPNPFDAYEGKSTKKNNKDATTQVVRPAQKARARKSLSIEKGAWTLGLSSQLSLTSSNHDVPNGEVSDSTVFARVVPRVGYFFWDRVEVGLGAGMMLRRFGRQDNEGSTSIDWLVEPYGRYHMPLGDKFWFVPGVSLGMYTGTSTREVQLVQSGEVKQLNEETSTLGIQGMLRADFVYALRERWGVNAGLAFNSVWGREHIESQNQSFWGATYHLGLGLGVVHHFE